jgi:hypothetical protein
VPFGAMFFIFKEPYLDTSVKIPEAFLGLLSEIIMRNRFHWGALLFFDFTLENRFFGGFFVSRGGVLLFCKS